MSEQRIEAKLPDYGTRTDEITIYAGPCSVESEEQFFEVADAGMKPADFIVQGNDVGLQAA